MKPGTQSYINGDGEMATAQLFPTMGQVMSGQVIVKAACDEEAQGCYLESSDEGALDEADGSPDRGDRGFPIELIAHANTRLRIRAAA